MRDTSPERMAEIASKFDDEKALAVVELARRGKPKTIQAMGAGIHKTTLNRWLERGEAGEEPYATFYEEWGKARAAWYSEITDQLQEHGMHNPMAWAALATLAERHFPEEFGRKTEIREEQNTQVTIRLERVGDWGAVSADRARVITDSSNDGEVIEGEFRSPAGHDDPLALPAPGPDTGAAGSQGDQLP